MDTDASRKVDSDYLRDKQYASGTNLSARISLHERFSTNREDWFHWLIGIATPQADEAILEVGCGTADMWKKYPSLIPESCRILLTDFSEGMISSARQSIANTRLSIDLRVMDAMNLDVPDASIDLVLANHMLYHVPDRDKAISELRRVLKKSGRLIASTNGRDHIKEIDEIIEKYAPNVAYVKNTDKFGLENGAEQLLRHFSRVERLDYTDSLIVTEAEPLEAYILSRSSMLSISEESKAEIHAHILEHFKQNGSFAIQKQSGAFRAYP